MEKFFDYFDNETLERIALKRYGMYYQKQWAFFKGILHKLSEKNKKSEGGNLQKPKDRYDFELCCEDVLELEFRMNYYIKSLNPEGLTINQLEKPINTFDLGLYVIENFCRQANKETVFTMLMKHYKSCRNHITKYAILQAAMATNHMFLN